MNKIITIGREFGSGGRELGKLIAENLQIPFYDKEIVRDIAKRTDMDENYVSQVSEQRPIVYSPMTTGRTFYTALDVLVSDNNSVYVEQNKILEELAKKTDCVIVGRCADYILSRYKPLRIFAYADLSFKMGRCRVNASEEEKEMSDKQLKHHIHRIDKNRSDYYEYISGNKWDDKSNYDMCVNTTQLPIENLAETIARLV